MADTNNKPPAAPRPPSAPVRAASAAAPAKMARVRLKVMATADGYYDNKLRRPGDVFTIVGDLPTQAQLTRKDGTTRDPKLPLTFSTKWMQVVDPKTPEQITSHNEVLRQHHDAVQGAKLAGGGPGPDNPEDTPDVLGAGDDPPA